MGTIFFLQFRPDLHDAAAMKASMGSDKGWTSHACGKPFPVDVVRRAVESFLLKKLKKPLNLLFRHFEIFSATLA